MTSPATLVVDANVVAKWYLLEPDSAVAARLLDRGLQLLAPDLVVAEFGNILWKKVRRDELAPGEAEDIALAFAASRPVTFRPTAPLLQPALHLAMALNHPIYDLIYVALAVAENTSLVTADRRLARLVAGTDLAPIVAVLPQS